MPQQPGAPEITSSKPHDSDSQSSTTYTRPKFKTIGTTYRMRVLDTDELYGTGQHLNVDFWRFNQYQSFMQEATAHYTGWTSKMHDLELFAKPESRQRPIEEKNLHDSLNQLLGGATILSSEVSRAMQEAAQDGSTTVSIGLFFKQIAKDGPRSNLEIPLSWLATSSFEGYTMADTIARYVYGVKADPADITTQREAQQQDIPHKLEQLLDTQIPIDVVKNATERLRKNPASITLSMLLQEVSRIYAPFMEDVATNLSSQQPIEHESAQLMLKAFQEFIATFPEPILIKEPLWKQWYNRIKHNRLFGKSKQPNQVFTPKEMARIVKGAKKISKKTDTFMGNINNAPSQVGKFSIENAMEQVRKSHPDGIIPAIEAAAKTNAELNNQPFEGRLPLSPSQEKYVRRLRKNDRERVRYYLEGYNYLLHLYQKYVGFNEEKAA